jgi:3-oxoacyl-[acyl-carrier protein] reductase
MIEKGITAMTKPLAIVFGGSRGIGAACVQALTADGFSVAFTYVSKADAAHALAASLPDHAARAYRADVGDPESIAQVFKDASHDFDAPPHLVLANAGINTLPGPMAQFPAADFRRLVEVNIVGAFNILSEAARQVQDGGAIIALTTSLVRHAAPGLGPYSATKAAVESMIRSMAKELAGRKIRVNAVAPGPVDTDLFRFGKNDEAKARSAAMSPFNRIGTPEEIAAVVSFLASEKSSWIHGQIIQPNGGLI